VAGGSPRGGNSLRTVWRSDNSRARLRVLDGSRGRLETKPGQRVISRPENVIGDCLRRRRWRWPGWQHQRQ